MIPGEYILDGPPVELNAERTSISIEVNNTGDRPIQVGSHFHFFEVNRALAFDRKTAYGMRLDIPAGTAVRFEPGDVKTVALIPLSGTREVYGGSGLVNGALDNKKTRAASLAYLEPFLAGDLPCVADLKKKPKGKKSKK
ncbi:MAG: urease subunit beta [Planctomycetes bacterium]|nr:urease subunit beta [Planctomycetota bacterium]